METRASYVLIGAFTLGVLVLAVAFVLWMGKTSLDREFDEYDIIFREAVTGLSVSGAVQYNGIQIGEVRRLSLDPKDPSRVIAHIRVAADTPVRTDTRAKLTFTGLTGVATIQLSGGSVAAPPLLPREGQHHGTIVADDSALQKLMVSGEDMVTSMNELLLRVSTLFSQQNIDKVSETLAHLESLSGEVAGSGGDIRRALADLAEAGKAMKQTLARADTLIARLDRASTTTQSLLDVEAREALAEMRDSLAAVRRVAEGADAVLAANRGALDSLGGQGLSQVGPVLTDMRSTLHRLNAMTEQLERDPARFLLGRDRPRERELR